jgi:ribonucleoside-diphosphate reductase alpha chain
MHVEQVFSKPSNPYEGIIWEVRSSEMHDAQGKLIFQEPYAVVPSTWSQIAVDILVQKYFRKADVTDPHRYGWKDALFKRNGTSAKTAPGSVNLTGIEYPNDGKEHDARQVFHRLAYTWMKWGIKENYFHSTEDGWNFYDETLYMLARQIAAPNSPQWFNTGIYEVYGVKGPKQGHYYYDKKEHKAAPSENAYERIQSSACYILPVKDDLVNPGGIMDNLITEARLFKYGSGVGTNFSTIRGINEKLSSGGYSSGLLSFLKVYDRATASIKSGGSTRRAAKMIIVDIDHPDIEEFIEWKAREEYKVVSLVTGSSLINTHYQAIKGAYQLNDEELIVTALSKALGDKVPVIYLYQILHQFKQGIFNNEPPLFSTEWGNDAYETVSGQSANNSVRVTDEFMNAVISGEDKDIPLINRTDKSIAKTVSVKHLWNKIVDSAWHCADPGIQFHDTINKWHTCPNAGPINASNPCSEYMFIDNTACNLASLNLAKFYDESGRIHFNIDAFVHAVYIWTIILDISIEMGQYPTEQIAELSYKYRTSGLGFANLGALLTLNGYPYDSDEGRDLASCITALMTAAAYNTSILLAQKLGAFPEYKNNKDDINKIVKLHHILSQFHFNNNNKKFYEEICRALDHIGNDFRDFTYCDDEQYEFRNAQVTLAAPTGTIGLLMDCDTTGIEPDFSLVKFKKLAGGGYFKIINQSIPIALKNLAYTGKEIKDIVEYATGHYSLTNCPYINERFLLEAGYSREQIKRFEEKIPNALTINDIFGTQCALFDNSFKPEEIEEAELYLCGKMTLEGAPHLKEEHLPVFDTAALCGKYGARVIPWQAHIEMMAAVQPFISGAISKTINMPSTATVNDVSDAYIMAWELGLKSITIYRDGSKLSQPLSSLSKGNDEIAGLLDRINNSIKPDTIPLHQNERGKRLKLPDKRNGYTQKVKIGGQSLFVHTGEYADGTPGEIFLDMHREGAAYRSLLNSFAIAISIGLQYGVPLEEFVDAFTFSRFEPNGIVCGHKNIKMATSVLDYIFRDLAISYLKRSEYGQVPDTETDTKTDKPDKTSFNTVVDEKVYNAKIKGYEGDPCPICGSFRLIRSGTCLRCDNCGNTTGCS